MFDWLPDEDVVPALDGEKLQKVMARAGLASRRVCEEMIGAGRVKVNGARVELGARVDAAVDVIEVDGSLLSVEIGLVHYLLNKPAGIVTTSSDPQGRRTVIDLVPDSPRVFPVGRLDAETEGLLIMTNDGPLTQRLTHPSYGIEKEYLAEVHGTLNPGALRLLRDGVELEDGMTAPARVSQPAPGLVRLVIHEGRNRQVRRMLASVGHPVKKLVRVRIGRLTSPNLRPGTWRELSTSEVRQLSVDVGPAPRPRIATRPPAPARQDRPGFREDPQD
jgi:23S rRNA pseudouridine2605 synthase